MPSVNRDSVSPLTLAQTRSWMPCIARRSCSDSRAQAATYIDLPSMPDSIGWRDGTLFVDGEVAGQREGEQKARAPWLCSLLTAARLQLRP